MRLPADPDEWTLGHAERAMNKAWRLFQQYERRYDATQPERTEELYRRYLHACQDALEILAALDVPEWIHQLP